MYDEVLEFWFAERNAPKWWAKDDAFDEEIRSRFRALHANASRCELFGWRSQPRGRLAEIIVLDQFSRNMFRGQPQSFASDALALALAQEAVSIEADEALTPLERGFLYMPFMHSESAIIQDIAVSLYSLDGLQAQLDFARKHKVIIDRFGRYPHRNSILNRTSTEEEREFLRQPDSTF